MSRFFKCLSMRNTGFALDCFSKALDAVDGRRRGDDGNHEILPAFVAASPVSASIRPKIS
ncbi:hypothetical protein D9M69_669000 [compost metagenome]